MQTASFSQQFKLHMCAYPRIQHIQMARRKLEKQPFGISSLAYLQCISPLNLSKCIHFVLCVFQCISVNLSECFYIPALRAPRAQDHQVHPPHQPRGQERGHRLRGVDQGRNNSVGVSIFYLQIFFLKSNIVLFS